MLRNCFPENTLRKGACLAIIGCVITAYPLTALAQKPNSQALQQKLDEQQPDDTVRITTDLVQTSVSVFDKNGKFINNLRAQDFELSVDGRLQPLLFFDRIINGTAGGYLRPAAQGSDPRPPSGPPVDAGRTVLFFVDDWHLNGESLTRTRDMLANYIEQDMGANDQAVITSASGQIGFLQQVTGEKDVLRAAVDRLRARPFDLADKDPPRMSVFQALAIEQNNADVLKYFEDVLLNDYLASVSRSNPQAARGIAERMTRSRAGRIVHQADNVATQTLAALNSAVRSSSQIPGRKLFVFVSDGFLVNNQNPDIRYRLQRITDAAVRVGAVLYTIQASGLNTTFPDASTDVRLVPGTGTGRLLGEDIANQEPLTELAADTGGQALLNANDLKGGMKRVLRESNDYYLLAWRPEADLLQHKQFHRIEVKVKGRADLSVLLQRGFFGDEGSSPPANTAESTNPASTPPAQQLADAIQGRTSGHDLRTSLTANYVDQANHGPTLSILLRVENPNGVAAGTVDVAAVIYDEAGKVTSSFLDTLKVERDSNGQSPRSIAYFDQIDVRPGLYQVRVAARSPDGLTGMAMQWVKVPDLSSRHLSLSSLLIGERDLGGAGNADQKAQLKIDRRFAQDSRLRFMLFIYNAARETNAPAQLNARVELFHGNKVIMATTPQVIETRGVDDPARIPFAGEFQLASMPRGRFLLRVTVTDRLAKAGASREVTFEIY